MDVKKKKDIRLNIYINIYVSPALVPVSGRRCGPIRCVGEVQAEVRRSAGGTRAFMWRHREPLRDVSAPGSSAHLIAAYPERVRVHTVQEEERRRGHGALWEGEEETAGK